MSHSLSAKSVTAAASEAGVNRWTIYDWLKQPDFRASLEAGGPRAGNELTRLGLDAIAVAAEGNVYEVLRKANTLTRSFFFPRYS